VPVSASVSAALTSVTPTACACAYVPVVRYLPSVPVSSLVDMLGFASIKDWVAFSEPFSLTYTDRTRDKLDTKTSRNALPLAAKKEA